VTDRLELSHWIESTGAEPISQEFSRLNGSLAVNAQSNMEMLPVMFWHHHYVEWLCQTTSGT